MLEKLTKKNARGFTLAELLVVVAIIAILVAVSIPIFTSKLEQSREATDVANMRAAKAAATIELFNADTPITAETTYYYDADAGKLITSAPANGYGKGTTKDGETTYKDYYANAAYTGSYIIVKAAPGATGEAGGETITLAWNGVTKP